MTKRWTDNDLILEQVGVTLCFAVICSWAIFRDLWGTRDASKWALALVYAVFLGGWVWEHHRRVRSLAPLVRRDGLHALSRTDVSTLASFSTCVVLAGIALAS